MRELVLNILKYSLLWVNCFYLGWLIGYDTTKDSLEKLHQSLQVVISLNIVICGAYLLINP